MLNRLIISIEGLILPFLSALPRKFNHSFRFSQLSLSFCIPPRYVFYSFSPTRTSVPHYILQSLPQYLLRSLLVEFGLHFLNLIN